MAQKLYQKISKDVWLATWADLEEAVIGGGSSRDLVPSSRPHAANASHWLVNNNFSVVFLKAVARLAYIRSGLQWDRPQTTALATFLKDLSFPVVKDPNLQEGTKLASTFRAELTSENLLRPEYETVRRLSRPEQAAFRENLRENELQCAISGCRIEEALEACHIKPHSAGGQATEDNGIILRRDLHRLFDLGLIALEPGSLTWQFHESLLSHYHDLIGAKFETNQSRNSLRLDALNAHWDASQLCNSEED